MHFEKGQNHSIKTLESLIFQKIKAFQFVCTLTASSKIKIKKGFSEPHLIFLKGLLPIAFFKGGGDVTNCWATC